MKLLIENGRKSEATLYEAVIAGDIKSLTNALNATDLQISYETMKGFLEIARYSPEIIFKVFASNKFEEINLLGFEYDFICNLTTNFVNKFFTLDKITKCKEWHLADVIKKTNNTDIIKKVLYSININDYDYNIYKIVNILLPNYLNLALEYLALEKTPMLDSINMETIWYSDPEFIYKVIDIMAAKGNYTILGEYFRSVTHYVGPVEQSNDLLLKKLIAVKDLDGLPLININKYQEELENRYSADPEMMQYLREYGFSHEQVITEEMVANRISNPQSAHERSVEENTKKQLAKLERQFPDLNIEQTISEIGACINTLQTDTNAREQSITFAGDSVAVGIRTANASKTITTTLPIDDALALATRAFDVLVAAVHSGTPDATKILALVWQQLYKQEVVSNKPYYYTSDLVKALVQIACEYIKEGQEIIFNASCIGGSLNILLDLSKTYELLISSTNQPQIPRINKVDFSQYVVEEIMPNLDQELLKAILDRIAKPDNTDGAEWRYEQALRAILNQSLYKFKSLQSSDAPRAPDDEDFDIVVELLPTIPQIYVLSPVEETTISGVEALKNSICNSFKQIFKLEATQVEITKNTIAHFTTKLKTLISKFINDTSEPSQIATEVSKYLADHEVNLNDFNRYGLDLTEQVEAFFANPHAANDSLGLIGVTIAPDFGS